MFLVADQQSGVLGLLHLYLKASPNGSMHVTLWMLLDFQNLTLGVTVAMGSVL